MTLEFEKIQNGIWQMSWEFVEKHGPLFGTVEDIFGELALTFMKFYPTWDRKKSRMITHIYYRCHMRLLEIQAGRGDNGKAWRDGPDSSWAVSRWQSLIEASEGTWEPPANDSPRFQTFWSDLSDDAKAIVNIVLNTPSVIARIVQQEGMTRFAFRTTIRSYLRGRGWRWERIDDAYIEIGDSLGGYRYDPTGWEGPPQKGKR